MIGKEFLDKYKDNLESDIAVPEKDCEASTTQQSTDNRLTTNDHCMARNDNTFTAQTDLELLISQIESASIDITTPYDTWLRILFAISDHSGESGRDYAHRISRFHTSYNPADCDKQYTYCLRAGKSGITIRTLFYIAQQHGILIHSPDPLGPGFAQHYFSDWSSELSIQLSQIPLVKVPPLIQDRGIGREALPNSELLLFPVDIFSLPIANFINLASKSINCPPDFIAVPVLTVLATAIGTSHSIQLKKGWIEGPHIFSAVVALPGSKKSPALSFATAPIRDIQRSFVIEYNANETEYKLQLCAFNIQAELWKKRKPEEKTPEDQPNAPEEPILKQIKTSNATIEAIAKLLDQNKRGILFEQDELAAWVKSMNAYRGGKGSDLENWLSFWNGSQVIINRAGAKKPLILDHPFVNVTGCIQPDLLSDLSGIKQNGFFDRILPSFPDPIPQRYTTDELPDEIAAKYSNIVKTLFNLQPVVDQEGTERPVLMYFNIPAREEWEKWNRMHDDEMNAPDLPYYLLGVWSKLQAYMARFILILQLTENASTNIQSCTVSPQAIIAAAELIHYFKSHIHKVYKDLFNSEMDRKVVLAVNWVRRHGGKVTSRMLLTNNVGKCASSVQVNELLTEMVERNIGTLSKTNPEGGGRPSIIFTLINPANDLESL